MIRIKGIFHNISLLLILSLVIDFCDYDYECKTLSEICPVLLLIHLGRGFEDYFSEDYDPSKNCAREEEMKKLWEERDPERCARASPLGSEKLQWEDCKRKMAKKLWLRCNPLNIAKENKNSFLHSHWLYIANSIELPALLCHKELAQGTLMPLKNHSRHAYAIKNQLKAPKVLFFILCAEECWRSNSSD